MLIRHIATGKVHEVVAGTRFPKQFFEEVTKEKIVSEKKDSTEKPTTGKVYSSRKKAEAQGAAIRASQRRQGKKVK